MMLQGQQENQMSNQYEPFHQFYHVIPTEEPKKHNVGILKKIEYRIAIKIENRK